ncbi:uncharacterized, partial [Tachysurus ichikawai]
LRMGKGGTECLPCAKPSAPKGHPLSRPVCGPEDGPAVLGRRSRGHLWRDREVIQLVSS